MSLDLQLKQKIESLIAQDRVVLFMKGTREQAQCGFSAKVIDILDELLPSYMTVNVLADPDIREGIKQYSKWPTIPQLYVDGEFIGGCDIIQDLNAKGDIFEVLKMPKPSAHKPDMHITPSAIDAFKNALEDSNEGECLRLKINANFEHNLTLDEKKPLDIEVTQDGITVLIDPLSASRAQGLRIDFTTNAMGSGFEIDNPNAPAAIKEMSVQELKAKMDQGAALHLFDVRSHDEWNTARIAGAKLLIDIPKQEIDGIDKEAMIVFHCRSGGRSQKMAEEFRKKGFRNLHNLSGGIRAWSREIDSSVPLY